MKIFLLSASLLASSFALGEELPKSCQRRPICTLEFRPTVCKVKDHEELKGFGTNRCRAMASLAYQFCMKDIPMASEEIVCTPSYPEILL